jgi:hypothetical protein
MNEKKEKRNKKHAKNSENAKLKIFQNIYKTQWNEMQIILFTSNVQLTISHHLLFSSYSRPRGID